MEGSDCDAELIVKIFIIKGKAEQDLGKEWGKAESSGLAITGSCYHLLGLKARGRSISWSQGKVAKCSYGQTADRAAPLVGDLHQSQ